MAPVQPKAEKKSATAILAIAQYMSKTDASPIPRNYELFYEALSGRNPDLLEELSSAGEPISQSALDAMGVRHRLAGQNAVAAEQARLEAAETLNSIHAHLQSLTERKQSYAQTLQNLTSHSGTAASKELDARLLKPLLDDMLLHEKNALLVLEKSAKELGAALKGIAAQRKVHVIDRLTGLPNKAAFSSRLTSLFEQETPRGRTVLMLVELSSFRAAAARMGPELANRVLRRFGVILRKSVKKTDYVARIGEQEFALLFQDVPSESVRSIALRLYGTVEEKLLPQTDKTAASFGINMTSGIATCEGTASANEYFAKAEKTLIAARTQAEPRIGVYMPPATRKTQSK